MYNLSEKIMGSFDIAQTKAISNKNVELQPIHLIYGLAKNPSLKSFRQLKDQLPSLEKAINALPSMTHEMDPAQLKPNSNFSAWISAANAQATEDGRMVIDEHDLLKSCPEEFRKFFNLESPDSYKSDKIEAPDFLTNLNYLAMKGQLDPVIGRSDEIRSTLEILGRRSKNNPILIGEAGVGKTAVVEGLAGLIQSGEIPEHLVGKTIYSLNLGSLVAGAKYRGDFEQRITTLLDFMKQESGHAILFIDEIHMLIGAGKTDGATDAANLLKPALARGEVKCIGATTQEEYQKYILADSALERRFRPVTIEEPTAESTIEILLGIKDKLEAHHGVNISIDAIYNAVFWSKQYIQHRHLPDKAIDLIDEASSSKKFSIEVMPTELLTLETELRSKQTLAKTEQANEKLNEEIKQLQDDLAVRKQAWQKSVTRLRELSELKKKVDSLIYEQQKAEKNGDFEKASKIKYAQIPEIETELKNADQNIDLTKEDIAKVLASMTGVPQTKILASKQEKILGVENYLKSQVFGQDDCMHEIAETLIAAHAGLTAPSRPLGCFMLAGPSGVGKTETARALSRFFFDSEDSVIRLDMSEYSEKHAIAKLIGSPAGYVGYDDGGILTEAIRKKPYSIILFDEIEKAHPDFSNILLQIMGDGILTDNKGRTVSFKNSMITLTTNAQDLESVFKPEVLGRLDAILKYKSFGSQVMQKLIDKELIKLNVRLEGKGVKIRLSDPVYEQIAKHGFSEKYGARPLNSYFQKTIVRPLSKSLLQGTLSPGKSLIAEQDTKQEGIILFHAEDNSQVLKHAKHAHKVLD